MIFRFNHAIAAATVSLLTLQSMVANAQVVVKASDVSISKSASKATQNLRDTLKAIANSPADNEALINLIKKKDEIETQELLAKFGLTKAQTSKIVFSSERGQKNDKCPQDTACLAVAQPAYIIGNSTPLPVGIVKIGGVWVEWNDLLNSWL